nr:MAG TPA: hypothetical protein [Caudoviricetes sp.]
MTLGYCKIFCNFVSKSQNFLMISLLLVCLSVTDRHTFFVFQKLNIM